MTKNVHVPIFDTIFDTIFDNKGGGARKATTGKEMNFSSN